MRRTLTAKAVAVELLSDPTQDRWSYELVQRIASDRGTINKILNRMVRAGWLTDFWEDPAQVIGRPPRHLYRVVQGKETEIREFITENSAETTRPHQETDDNYAYADTRAS